MNGIGKYLETNSDLQWLNPPVEVREPTREIELRLTGNMMRFSAEHFDLALTREYFGGLLTFQNVTDAVVLDSGIFMVHMFLALLLVMVALAGVVGHALMNWSLVRIPLWVGSTFTLLIPVVSAMLAWVFLDEPRHDDIGLARQVRVKTRSRGGRHPIPASGRLASGVPSSSCRPPP